MAFNEQYYQLISTLAVILDRDGKVKLNHSLRAAVIAGKLAEIVMPRKANLFIYLGLLHDVGGVGLPHHTVHYGLNETTGQEEEDFINHPLRGEEIVAAFPGLREGACYIEEHHERFDGRGYPGGKKGDELSTGGQILMLADQLELQIRDQRRSRTDIYNFFRREKGRMFNPELWPALLQIIGTADDLFYYQISDDQQLPFLMAELKSGLEPLKIEEEHADYILQAIKVFGQIIDAKHSYTEGHSQRVAVYGSLLAEFMGLNEKEVDRVKKAGYLHDLGKVAIPLQILNKKGSLTESEYKQIKSHVVMTMELLDYIPALRSLSPIAGGHHERWDGTGYPDGLKGDEIPLGGRILAVADAFDALTTSRSYHLAESLESAVNELLKKGGTHFDPELVALLKQPGVREAMKKAGNLD